LRTRLTELIRHCKGETSDRGPHYGGEIVWQLKNYEKFEAAYLPTGGPPAPKQLKGILIKEFESLTGKPPFGNRQH
jgi:hypothetical protein